MHNKESSANSILNNSFVPYQKQMQNKQNVDNVQVVFRDER